MSTEPDANPSSPAAATRPSRGRLGPIAKMIAQVLGFGVGIALLVWCISVAFKPGNRAALTNLREASIGQIALMIGLSLAVLFASGGTFRETLLPIKRLPMMEALATNVIACLLSLLPFKLSVFFRIFIHNRRDGVPLLTIGAWFSAVAVVIMCVLLPMLGASVWRGRADALWFVAAGGGMLAMLLAVLLVARSLRTDSGWAWLQSHYARLPLPAKLRIGSPFAVALFEKSHEGVRMLASPRVVFGCAALRILDIAAQAGRIAVAAAILHVALPWDHALLAGSAFFVIGAAAPSGALGVREAGTAKLMAYVLPGVDMERFTVVVLTVTATEAAVMIVGSVAAAVYLRPDRLMRVGDRARQGDMTG